MAERSVPQGFIVYEWMFAKDGLALTPTECLIYAQVFAVTQNGVGVYVESKRQLARRFGLARSTVARILSDFVERGLVTRQGARREDGGAAVAGYLVVNEVAAHASWHYKQAEPERTGYVTDERPRQGDSRDALTTPKSPARTLSKNESNPLRQNDAPPLSENRTPPIRKSDTPYPKISHFPSPDTPLSENRTPPLSENRTPPIRKSDTPIDQRLRIATELCQEIGSEMKDTFVGLDSCVNAAISESNEGKTAEGPKNGEKPSSGAGSHIIYNSYEKNNINNIHIQHRREEEKQVLTPPARESDTAASSLTTTLRGTHRAPSSAESDAFNALCARSLVEVAQSYRTHCLDLYLTILDRGFSRKQVAQAYENYREWIGHGSRRPASLTTWLKSPKGFDGFVHQKPVYVDGIAVWHTDYRDEGTPWIDVYQKRDGVWCACRGDVEDGEGKVITPIEGLRPACERYVAWRKLQEDIDAGMRYGLWPADPTDSGR